jgi:hypothetical protein
MYLCLAATRSALRFASRLNEVYLNIALPRQILMGFGSWWEDEMNSYRAGKNGNSFRISVLPGMRPYSQISKASA